MKFLAALILTALLSFIAGLYLPWWGIVIAAFVVGLLVIQKAGLSFLAGFFGILLLWGGLSFWIDLFATTIFNASNGKRQCICPQQVIDGGILKFGPAEFIFFFLRQ